MSENKIISLNDWKEENDEARIIEEAREYVKTHTAEDLIRDLADSHISEAKRRGDKELEALWKEFKEVDQKAVAREEGRLLGLREAAKDPFEGRYDKKEWGKLEDIKSRIDRHDSKHIK